MTEDNIEIGICNAQKGFRRLSPEEVKDYLASIAWINITISLLYFNIMIWINERWKNIVIWIILIKYQ